MQVVVAKRTRNLDKPVASWRLAFEPPRFPDVAGFGHCFAFRVDGEKRVHCPRRFIFDCEANEVVPPNTTVAEERSAESTLRVLVGDCQIQLTGDAERERRGQVLVLIKPDNTVLVHDIEGYRPVAWMTRAETVSIDDEEGILTAVDGDQWLRIDLKHEQSDRQFAGSKAGEPVSTCITCRSPLVDAGNSVHCVGCDEQYGLPRGASLLDERCECGLPRMRVVRGDQFELCIDRSCEPLQEVVSERFDGRWECPDAQCDGRLRIIHRGGLMIACDAYPDCNEQYSMPIGTVENTCGCGLPRFRINGSSQCLDSSCAKD